MRMRSKLLAMPVLALFSACALEPPPRSSENLPEALPNLVLPERFGTDADVAGTVAGGWAARFNDPRLDALIAEAVEHNPDLLVAAARIEVAAQYVEVADSKLYPQV